MKQRTARMAVGTMASSASGCSFSCRLSAGRIQRSPTGTKLSAVTPPSGKYGADAAISTPTRAAGGSVGRSSAMGTGWPARSARSHAVSPAALGLVIASADICGSSCTSPPKSFESAAVCSLVLPPWIRVSSRPVR